MGIWEGVLRGCAQEEQNRLSGKFCAEHFGHCTIDGGVIGFCDNAADYMRSMTGKKACSGEM